MADRAPDLALFVGGFVAALFWLAAGLAVVAAPGVEAVCGLAVVFAALGGLFLAGGAAVALAVRWFDRR